MTPYRSGLVGFFPFLLILLAGFLPQQPGLWAIQSSSWFLPLLALSLVFYFVFFLILTFAGRDGSTTGPNYLERLNKPFQWPWIFFTASAFSWLLYAFRMGLFAPPPTGLGDSIHLLEYVPVYTQLFGYLGSFDEILELYWHSIFYTFLKNHSNLGILESYQFLSIFAGFLYIFLIGIRFRRDRVSLAGLALLLLTPAIQLFAGYVENYTLTALLIGTLLHTGVLYLENPESIEAKFGKVLPLFFFGFLAALGATHHMILGFAGPALVYLVYSRSGGWNRDFVLRAMGGVAGALLVFGVVWGYFLLIHPNPISPGSSFAFKPAIYPPGKMFGFKHFLDWFNLLFLASPALLFLLFAGPGTLRLEKDQITPALRFTGVAALSFIFHSWIWNPMIGFPADWDLFTMFQIPLNLMVYLGIQKRARPIPHLVQAGMVLFAFSITAGWVLRNHGFSETSRANLAHARSKVDGFLSEMDRDPVYPQIPGLVRKRTYVEAKLFIKGAQMKLEADPGLDPGGMSTRLTIAETELTRLILLPEGEYGPALQKTWGELTDINIQLSRIEQEKNR